MKHIFYLIIALLNTTMVSAQEKASTGKPIREVNVGGYMITKVEKSDTTFNAGYPMYAAAWPLVKQYPGRAFQDRIITQPVTIIGIFINGGNLINSPGGNFFQRMLNIARMQGIHNTRNNGLDYANLLLHVPNP